MDGSVEECDPMYVKSGGGFLEQADFSIAGCRACSYAKRRVPVYVARTSSFRFPIAVFLPCWLNDAHGIDPEELQTETSGHHYSCLEYFRQASARTLPSRELCSPLSTISSDEPFSSNGSELHTRRVAHR